MTLSTLTSRVSYPGAGSAGPFAFPFKIFAASDLVVTKRVSTGTETTLTYGTQYSVTGVNNATGSVTLVTPLAATETLVIRRAPALTQPTSIRNQGPYFAATHEAVFDRIVMQLQDLRDRTDRSFKLPETYDGNAYGLFPSPAAGYVLGWKADGTGLEFKAAQAFSFLSTGLALVNAKDPLFGAVGNGVADDTAALLLWAAAIPAGAIGIVPTGSYKINGEITGFGSGIKLDLSRATFTQIGSNKCTILLNAVSDIEIIGGRFVGKGTEHNGVNTAWNGVAAIGMKNGCTNISIHGVKATNHAGGSIRWNTSINGLRVYDCKLVGIGAAGGIVAGDNNDDVAIGGYATNPDNDVIITNNDISGHCFGIQVAYGTRCLIGWNSFHDIPGQHAIYNAATSRVLIIGNIFQTIAYIGIKNQIADAATICTDIAVIANQFNTCGQTAIATLCVNFTNSYYNRVKIFGNQIYNCGAGYGIQADYVREYECSNNAINTVTAGPGIALAHGYGVIKNNTIKTTSWNAIAATSVNHDTEISGNTIVDACLNTEAGGDSNNLRYLIFLQKDAASLVANPKVLIFDNTFRTTVAEGGFYLAVVFAATGTYVYYYGANKNLTTKTAISMQTAADLQQCDVIANVTSTYGVNIFPDRSLGDKFNIVATNGTAFTIQPPSNTTPGIFTIKIKNTSGGALGVATFSGFKLGAAWAQPATGFSRSITFYHDGVNPIEISRTAADVAN